MNNEYRFLYLDMPIITLTTDWNENDFYVSAIKGKILSQCPHALIIDVSHQIQTFNITQAAFIIRNSFHHFPACPNRRITTPVHSIVSALVSLSGWLKFNTLRRSNLSIPHKRGNPFQPSFRRKPESRNDGTKHSGCPRLPNCQGRLIRHPGLDPGPA